MVSRWRPTQSNTWRTRRAVADGPSGDSGKVAMIAKMAVAKAKGEQPDLGEHEKFGTRH